MKREREQHPKGSSSAHMSQRGERVSEERERAAPLKGRRLPISMCMYIYIYAHIYVYVCVYMCVCV